MAEKTTKTKALVLRDFTDAGTGENFTKDATPSIESGVFANYEAAGLVGRCDTKAATASPASSAKDENPPA
ncbi:hypothetical protein HMF7854_04455 [Sphingomonas ginkgonis]|uniref:Uncharacterized protein n=1 Tax=Sphingomonas ginkgonis TaxID=2315330 RepID=A0A3R9WRL8_9SPHN|nr:hypothetical protein [Sphingomonas ginkgonis]RST30160.1 hypothetical protein HMF7854_04455 [Sphingomonas ginkgonis]